MPNMDFQKALDALNEIYQKKLVSLCEYLLTYLIAKTDRERIIRNQLDMLLQEKKSVR